MFHRETVVFFRRRRRFESEVREERVEREIVLIYSGKRTRCWHFFTWESGESKLVSSANPSRPIDCVVEARGRLRTQRNYVISWKFHFDYSWNPCLCLTSNFHFESINQARDDSMHRHEGEFRVNWSRVVTCVPALARWNLFPDDDVRVWSQGVAARLWFR